MKILLISLLSMVLSNTPVPTGSPKWEGTWKAYSTTDNTKVIGELVITKIKGKEYSWTYWYDSSMSYDEPNQTCKKIELTGSGTWNGVLGLNSGRGIGFTYYQDKDMISVFHTYEDQELTDWSYCFGGDFYRFKQ